MIWRLSLVLFLVNSFTFSIFGDETKSTRYEVDVKKNIAYRSDKDADPVKHKLDLYLPEKIKDFPVLLFVHGGTWQSGYKELYAPLGVLFARCGIGTAIINYRLSNSKNQIKHPDHIQDVAKAFAWVHANIAKYGGLTEQIFLCGHSAGGHLVSLLATDESYLKAEKCSFQDIRGVMPISGVYNINPIVRAFHNPFGTDLEVCRSASPIIHVKENLPPFLITYADKDLPTLGQLADDFHAKLKLKKCDSELCKIESRDHNSIIIRLALNEEDPCTTKIMDFIAKRSQWKKK